PEIASRLAIHQVAPAIRALGLDECVVGVDRIFEHIVAIADAPRLLTLREQRAEGGRRKERANAGARGPAALGESPLRSQLKLELAGAIRLVEVPRVGLPRKGAEDLAHALCGDQCREA